MTILLSVVVGTYNRAKVLSGLLQTLAEQSLDSSEYEVIVVDNNSTDRTSLIVQEYSRQCPHFYHFLEVRQGSSHARNRGWQEARGEYVAFVDDDCRVPPQWLETAREIINRVSPDVFGGPYFAFYDAPKPRWFKDAYGSRERSAEAEALPPRTYLPGGNLFVRRKLLGTVGGFDVGLGPTGQRMAYGEDTEIQMRIEMTMPERAIYYDPRLYVHHLVRPEKWTLRWLVRSSFAKGYGGQLIHGKDVPCVGWLGLLAKAVKALVGLALDVTCGVLWRDRAQYPQVQNYLYEHSLGYLYRLGSLYAQYQQIR